MHPARYHVDPPAVEPAELVGVGGGNVRSGRNRSAVPCTKNSRLLAERLPNAEIRIYPDANHGFLDQYPEQFAEFLNS